MSAPKHHPIRVNFAFELKTFDQIPKAKAALKGLFPKAHFAIEAFHSDVVRRRRRFRRS